MATDVVAERFAGTWKFNPVHSSASFAVKYLVASFRGRFEEVEASFADGRLTGEVQVASVAVKDENLAAHLQAPDFFDGERHPTISFASDALTVDGDRVDLEGQLTIKGVTKPVHATGTVVGPVEGAFGQTAVGFTLETTVDRTEYGLNWNADLPKGGKALSDDVTLTVELEFVKA
jgi:polyisoprenoid-binding protein YceI